MLRRFIVILALALGAGLAAHPAVAARVIPNGFWHSKVASVPLPTDFDFLPDGRMLITSKTGQVWVLKDGELLSAPALDIEARMCTDNARGLLGITHHPQFGQEGGENDWIYVHHNNHNGTKPACPRNEPDGPFNQVTRFRMQGDTILTGPGNEETLLHRLFSPNGQHDGGALEFGHDGFLYVTVGDGSCHYVHFANRARCGPNNDAARDPNVLVGKVLRLTPEGEPAPGNPFAGRPRSEDCAELGMTDPAGEARHCNETYATGLRNPWRMAFDPDAAGTVFRVHDVGQGGWEEINRGVAGADYGWNCKEGPDPNPARSARCRPLPRGLTDPAYAYSHRKGCKSITGGAYVPDAAAWPGFRNRYLYGDYVCNKIFILRQRPHRGGFERSPLATRLGFGGPVSIGFGPYRDREALYYTTFARGGEVRRIAHTAGNTPPVARIRSVGGQVWKPPRNPADPDDPSWESSVVELDASQSDDADGDELEFRWVFGDGSADLVTDEPVVAHDYGPAGSPGRYQVTLTVSDGRDDSDPVTVEAFPENSPPEASIDAAPDSFAVGEELLLVGSMSDLEDDAEPGTEGELRWTALQWHDADHTHPYALGTGPGFELVGPEPEDLHSTPRGRNYLEVQLVAEDSLGLRSQAQAHAIRPRMVRLPFETRPDGFRFFVNNQRFLAPRAVRFWEDWQVVVRGANQRDAQGRRWRFGRWSDGGAREHAITPSALLDETPRLRAVHVRPR